MCCKEEMARETEASTCNKMNEGNGNGKITIAAGPVQEQSVDEMSG
jgi:hypothetical protein